MARPTNHFRRARTLGRGSRARLGAILLGALLTSGPARAATFVVDSTGDGGASGPTNDGVCDAAAGPGVVCTLRAAIAEANGTAGADIIQFNIGAGGPQTISPGSSYATITETVTIDGTTQPGFAGTPIIEINGASSGGAHGFSLSGAASAGSTIKGLVIGQFNQGIRILVGSSGNVIQGNYIGTDQAGTAPSANTVGVYIETANNQVGGSLAGERNVISANSLDGIQISGASATGNVVQGNYIGIDANGTTALGNAAQGIAIFGGASNNTVGGTGAGEGNVISGNGNFGVGFGQSGTTGNLVEGNLIGTDAAGTGAVPNLFGVGLQDTSSGNLIGDPAGSGNTISGNNNSGILIDNSTGNTIQNNRIGTDAAGTSALANGQHGIHALNASNNNVIGGAGVGNVISGNTFRGVDIGGSTGIVIEDNLIGRDATNGASIPNGAGGVRIDSNGNTVGGTGANVGNVIAGNGAYGVGITGNATGNAVLRNSTFANAGLGIDLSADGVTGNDVDDGDAGENGLQNFPVLSAAATNGVFVHIAGSLDSAPSTTYRVEFFASSAADPTGFGEGERYLGFSDVTTDGSGDAVVRVTLNVAVAAGEVVSATATDPSNNTSEFAANATAVGDLIVTTTADTVDGTTTSVAALISDTGADGRISLREAIQATNNTAGADTIHFGIPLTDAGHFYYQDDAAASSLSMVTGATRADADITDFDADYPAGLARSWYRIEPTSNLPSISEALVIDASTQPGSLVNGPVVELAGTSAGLGARGLGIGAAVTIRGLIVNQFDAEGISSSGASTIIQGCYVGTDPSGTLARGNGIDGTASGVYLGGDGSQVGGTTLAERNVLSGNVTHGLWIDADNVTVQGNYIGTDVTGTADVGNNLSGVVLQDVVSPTVTNVTVGGTAAGSRNVISGNDQHGIVLLGAAVQNNVILGNHIGTDVTGAVALPNAQDGVRIESSASLNTVGGTAAGAGNVISGNGDDGLFLDAATNNVIEGNYIGVDATGTGALGNLTHGISMGASVADNTIGGTAAGAGNVIAHNAVRGIGTAGTTLSGNSFLGNSIHSNGNLGIDLGADGVTLNDEGDVDSGPNDLLNFPGIYQVTESGGTLTVDITLNLVAGSYRIEYFKNPSGADPSGHGEGETFASSQNITHTGSGFETFSHSFPGSAGDTITATTTFCTDGGTCAAFGSTSEFSNAFTEGVTPVELTSFTAVAGDGAVELQWETASEVDNLGFHLYRSDGGGYERITDRVIPGLGSSPTGAEYRHRDEGLTNGVTYYYQLEDIDTAGKTERHGPVSATPREGAEESSDEDEASGGSRITVGDPSAGSLKLVRRSRGELVLTLETGGFYAEPQEDGSVQLSIPGFDALIEPNAPGVPVRRTWVEAIAGRRVNLVSVTAREVEAFTGLTPSGAEIPELVVGDDGTLRAGRNYGRRARAAFQQVGLHPSEAARVVSVGFQGDVKKALVELSPLRWDGSSGRLLLAHRLVVRLSFRGREPAEETTDGVRGRRRQRGRDRNGRVMARLATTERGLHAVSFEDVFGRRRRATRASNLRLSRHGEAVPYHLEPRSDRFGPGSTLYFVSDGSGANPYGNEAVYELERAPRGDAMEVADASPAGDVVSYHWQTLSLEQNRYYQAALVDAPDQWLWELIMAPATERFSFNVDALAATAEPSRVSVWLQGASDLEVSNDHHARVYVNGVLVDETSWDGKHARQIEAEIPPGVVVEGENRLEIENVGDTGAAYSMVMLDRFEVRYPRRPSAVGGRLEGWWDRSGFAELSGLGSGALLLDTTESRPRWLDGALAAGADGLVRARVEARRRYLAVSPGAVLEPDVRRAVTTRLAREQNRADYVVIAPKAFLPAVAPLVDLRRARGLRVEAVSIEDVYAEFGFGEARPEAIRDFLSHAYHRWRTPPRYVVLVGDATFDFKDHLETGVRNQVPPLLVETTYLWTASDPSYATVNGEDILPDLAIGRLPAATLEEARSIVEKIVAYETGDTGVSGAPVVLVADDPDEAGNFVANADALASSALEDRDVRKIYLDELGAAATRASILRAFDEGASLMSYVGHGAIHLWAGENIFNSSRVDSLAPQPQQPIVLTLNCLNGYFHFPYFDSLSEALLKAKGKGAIAAFSPSGLSLNGPAHLYHQALLEQILHGGHERLGDAVMAAQESYARTGAFPELLSIYHLFGDPALTIR